MKNLSTLAIAFLFLIPILSFAQPKLNPALTNYTSQSGFVENMGQSKILPGHHFSWHHNNVFAYFMKDRIVFFFL